MPSPTRKVVVGLMAAALVVVIWSIMPARAAVLCTFLLSIEAWTLVNRWQGDTISEEIWRLAERPIVPWLFGCATAWGVSAGYLSDPWVLLGVGFLEGHFFFQSVQKRDAGRPHRVITPPTVP